MDGWITIGTTLDNKNLDKKLKKLESKLKTEEIDLDIKYGNADVVINNLRKAEEELENLKQKQNAVNQETKEFFSKLEGYRQKEKTGTLSVAEALHLQDSENQVQAITQGQISINNEVEKQAKLVDDIRIKLSQTQGIYEKQEIKVSQIKDDITEVRGQIIQANQEAKQDKLNEIEQKLKNIGNSSENVVKKVAKWGLAIFSVRSAYMFVRQAVSTLSQYNEKIGTDIEYIRYALASALQPIIENIIQLMYKMLAYINYISQAWFGVNIFANASAKAFNNVKKGLGGANKQAKELQKTLLGFDEMNILQDGSTSKGGGGGGVTLPSYDLGNMEDVEIPDWIKWIADNGELIKTILIGIAGAITGLKLAQLLFNLTGIGSTLPEIFTALSNMSGLQIFGLVGGIATAVVGIFNTIKALIVWIGDPTWENFKEVLSGLEIVLIGVGIAMVALNASNPIGWITIAVGLLGKLVGALTENETKTLDLTEAQKKLNNAEKEFVNAQNRYTTAIKNRDQALKDLQKAEKNTKLSGEDLYKSVMTGKLKFDDMTKTQQSVYLAYVKYKGTIGDVEQATKDLQAEEHELILASLEEQATVAATKNNFEDFAKTLNNLVDKGTISVEEAYKIINDIFGKMQGLGKDVFNIQFPKYFSSSTDSAEKLRKKVQDLYNQYKKLKDLGFPSTSGSSYSSKTLWAKGGVLTYAKGGIYKPIKLASGAVVNQPGRGVPIGLNAIAGEHGAEGIIPLTDAQQMDLLGSAIGRRVTVNLTNITEMNGRIISRELQRVQNQEGFAFNE